MEIRNSDGLGTERDLYTVSRLNREARQLLEGAFPLLWVEGEISNLSRPASGHIYFSLKDDQSQIRCALFRQYHRHLRASVRDGLHVIVRARVSLYEGRGDFQLIVEHLEEAGEGALRLALEALKQRLGAEGLFAQEHKRPLPRLPRRLGVITSPSGAVIHDILMTLRRRFPAIVVRLYPVPVQGEGAAEQIAAAIALADRQQDCDALILARGGGSLEDLWAFNEEIVARAIYDCALPLVCGVGHETDFTIADLVADARAPTPTAAAEMLSPDQHEWLARLLQHERQLERLVRKRLADTAQQLDWSTARLIDPKRRLELMQQRLILLVHRLNATRATEQHHLLSAVSDLNQRLLRHSPASVIRLLGTDVRHLATRLRGAMRQQVRGCQERLTHLASRMHGLSPLATLARGYAVVSRTRDGRLLRRAVDARTGETVQAQLAEGRLDCRVEKIHEKD